MVSRCVRPIAVPFTFHLDPMDGAARADHM